MSTKRERALDAAIEILGTQSLRALTHRAVDERAELPPGSTSNYFRTREALLTGVVARLEERDRADWAAQNRTRIPTTVDELVDGLVVLVEFMIGQDRVRNMARYALLHETAHLPALRQALRRGHENITDWVARTLGEIHVVNHTEDRRAADRAVEQRLVAKALIDYLDGLVLHQLTTPTPGFAPRAGVDLVVRALLSRRSRTAPPPPRS
ncbi:TetR family transcriptional regulator [Nocardia panacis]|uniref:TetR family transcriptional regulator n=1 Tax=Nocardia panacis TaxID=2340916 RepID=A0A3A4JY91_9NOCA|nr:TetR family transcriptional regulator [Nocardia panacis]RJO69280.1 TetR family transcriptional regulator [Nocardia panacis]